MAVHVKILLGEHPSRGAMFPEDLWEMMEWCWTFQPDDRPSIADVLRCLKAVSNSSESTPRSSGEVEMCRENQAPFEGFPNVQTGTSRTIATKGDIGINATDNGQIFILPPPQPQTTEATGERGCVIIQPTTGAAGEAGCVIIQPSGAAGEAGYLIIHPALPSHSISSRDSDERGADQVGGT